MESRPFLELPPAFFDAKRAGIVHGVQTAPTHVQGATAGLAATPTVTAAFAAVRCRAACARRRAAATAPSIILVVLSLSRTILFAVGLVNASVKTEPVLVPQRGILLSALHQRLVVRHEDVAQWRQDTSDHNHRTQREGQSRRWIKRHAQPLPPQACTAPTTAD